MHFCQDEAVVAATILGSIGACCRYAWHRVTGLWRKGGVE